MSRFCESWLAWAKYSDTCLQLDLRRCKCGRLTCDIRVKQRALGCAFVLSSAAQSVGSVGKALFQSEPTLARRAVTVLTAVSRMPAATGSICLRSHAQRCCRQRGNCRSKRCRWIRRWYPSVREPTWKLRAPHCRPLIPSALFKGHSEGISISLGADIHRDGRCGARDVPCRR